MNKKKEYIDREELLNNCSPYGKNGVYRISF